MFGHHKGMAQKRNIREKFFAIPVKRALERGLKLVASKLYR
jgi:hypothetical protein